MDPSVKQLLQASYELEEAIAEYYRLLSMKYPEDRDFWWQLHEEERNHSAIYSSFLNKFMPMQLFTEAIIDTSLPGILECTSRVLQAVSDFNNLPLEKHSDYARALEFESGSSENIFQEAMKVENPGKELSIIQTMIGQDILHKEKISQKIKELG